MKTATLAAAALLLVAATACGGSAPTPHPSTPTHSLVGAPPVGTLSGRLIAAGGPADAADTTLAGTITIKGAGGSVLHADVGKNGVFQIQLSPGTYRLTGRSPQYMGGTTDCTTATPTTTLVANLTVTADILCQRR